MSAELPLLVLGSTSRHKVGAVGDALIRLGLDASVKFLAVETQSGVPEQPLGLDETRAGAWKRAKSASLSHDPAVLGLGIESGLLQLGGSFVDVAVVALIEPGCSPRFATSLGVEMPAEFVELDPQVRIWRTAGERYAARHGCDATDWHSHATGGRLPRRKLIEDAVVAVLSQRFGKGGNDGK